MKKQNKESRKQTLIDEARRRAIGEGSCVAPKYPDHSNSYNDSSGFANDDKTESEPESENEDSDVDSKQGDESDKSSFDEEISDYDESDKDTDNGDDHTRALMIKPTDKEPEQQPKEFPTQAQVSLQPQLKTSVVIMEYIHQGRYGVSVPALTKDHKGKKSNTPYPEKLNTSYSRYSM
ncbi:hypothetical protein Tco_0092479 [Tanacetum coccineum]